MDASDGNLTLAWRNQTRSLAKEEQQIGHYSGQIMKRCNGILEKPRDPHTNNAARERHNTKPIRQLIHFIIRSTSPRWMPLWWKSHGRLKKPDQTRTRSLAKEVQQDGALFGPDNEENILENHSQDTHFMKEDETIWTSINKYIN